MVIHESCIKKKLNCIPIGEAICFSNRNSCHLELFKFSTNIAVTVTYLDRSRNLCLGALEPIVSSTLSNSGSIVVTSAEVPLLSSAAWPRLLSRLPLNPDVLLPNPEILRKNSNPLRFYGKTFRKFRFPPFPVYSS